MKIRQSKTYIVSCTIVSLLASIAQAQIAVRGKTVYTMAGPPITNGVVIIEEGKISAVGTADQVTIPNGMKVIDANIVTPGLIDAHSTVGLTGIYNIKHDQDQLEHSTPIQPELRAIDAYNSQEQLLEYIRGYGITTIHTGHAPGELISGQTFIVKTIGNTVEDAIIVETAAMAATLSPAAKKSEKGKSPGTRGKMMAMLRVELIKAQEYQRKRTTATEDKKPARSLRSEALVRVLNGELPMMITANRVQDIANVLRLAKEFNIKVWLDGACESYMMIDEIKKAGIPVLIHPTMQRAFRDTVNLSMETAAKLLHAGIPVAMQSGYESYVPKTRVVLFEAAMAAANGLSFDEALRIITIDAAKILGIDRRVGSLVVGKDGDLAMYDGDPFEYITHCTGTIINGQLVSDKPQ